MPIICAAYGTHRNDADRRMTQTQKKPAPKDWHPADIKAALTKAGWSFNQLGLAHGYTSKSTLTAVLRQPWPKAERIVADAIGVHPMTIWPSRYRADGTPNRVKGRQPVRPAGASAADFRQGITGGKARNTQSGAGISR
ncbi:Nlp family transcriptional regulator [Mizugakiibacter sediminis]|uniref:Nlp family transcriptional regulator n=2 Tax=Mizugakiibacter sediminis TaxID=1475481 RepID=A0A0K8QPG8_9GAMM|nr:Nlp family transcriptional regulator [Mizugakiibacter sediminis]